MSFDAVIAELQQIYGHSPVAQSFRSDRIIDADIQKWSDSLCISRAEFYDRLAIYLALNFQNGTLTFEFCDTVVNEVHSVITFADEHRPELFWSVYLAFDEGEYYHNGNRDQDPVAVYTVPMINEIITAYRKQQGT